MNTSIVEQFLTENSTVEHDLIQGTPEWESFRMEHDGSSEAAAMLGMSKNVTRTALLDAKHTGVSKEFNEWVRKNILEHGHEVEALARPIIELQLDRSLYPVVVSKGRMSASCDGKTAAGDVLLEHKQWNEALAESVLNGVLPDEHWPQCQQALLVNDGAERLIFTVSDGTPERMVSMEVLPDYEKWERLVLGWAQFEKDLATYVPPVIVADSVAEPVKNLPAVVYEMNGMSLTSNIATVVKPAVLAQIAKYEKKPVTDQDFADLDEFTKSARASVKKSAVLRETVMAKIVDVDKFNRELIELEDLLTKAAISGEKVYKAENENRKNAIKATGPARFAEHVAALQAEIVGVTLVLPAPDWTKAAYGLKSLKSLENAIDTCLANAKIEADAIARDIRIKLDWAKENAAGHSALFPDLQQIIVKPMEDFALTITSRIEKAKADEAAKLEAERAKMQAEATAKAEREAAANLAQEEARIRAEERERIRKEEEAKAQQAVQSAAAPEPVAAQPEQIAQPSAVTTIQPKSDTGKTIKLGEISSALGFTVTAEFMATLGFQATTERSAKIYHWSDFNNICNAIVNHVQKVAANYKIAA